MLISVLPAAIANLNNLEILNLSNNHLDELPLSLSAMPKLRILNCSINRLNSLPRWVTILFAAVGDIEHKFNFSGFGAFPVLEVLDLSYNNLNENVLPGNFFKLGKTVEWEETCCAKSLSLLLVETLRALYLGDNDFEYLPPEVKNMKNLQIVS